MSFPWLSGEILNAVDLNNALTASIGGDGSDGNVTVSTTINLTKDMFYDTLVISSGGIINTNSFRIFAKTLNNNLGGIIQNNGNNGSDGGGGQGGSPRIGGVGGAGGAPVPFGSITGGIGGSKGGDGGNGAYPAMSGLSATGGSAGEGGKNANPALGGNGNAGVAGGSGGSTTATNPINIDRPTPGGGAPGGGLGTATPTRSPRRSPSVAYTLFDFVPPVYQAGASGTAPNDGFFYGSVSMGGGGTTAVVKVDGSTVMNVMPYSLGDNGSWCVFVPKNSTYQIATTGPMNVNSANFYSLPVAKIEGSAGSGAGGGGGGGGAQFDNSPYSGSMGGGSGGAGGGSGSTGGIVWISTPNLINDGIIKAIGGNGGNGGGGIGGVSYGSYVLGAGGGGGGGGGNGGTGGVIMLIYGELSGTGSYDVGGGTGGTGGVYGGGTSYSYPPELYTGNNGVAGSAGISGLAGTVINLPLIP